VTAAASAWSGEFEADYSAQGSTARSPPSCCERFPAQGGVVVDVVVQADGGLEPARPEVEALLAELGSGPDVLGTVSPWEPGGTLSADGRTGLGALRLDAAVASRCRSRRHRS
jgi:hypothetical protein